MSDEGWTTRPVVGLEIHVQLATRTKMFCGCRVAYGAPPNTCVCPVCLGMPGTLPTMNRRAVEFALTTAMALNCEIATQTKWDRKSYFYPDLPKNYQISQYDQPIGRRGYFDVPTDGGTGRVGIRRVHLEEDAGKNIHDTPGGTLVDLNRAGTPLLEIVTEPDIGGADEAHIFCMELQRLVRYLGVSDGVMERGQMRFEPNVNVHLARSGSEYRTPIAEIKNLNSFRSVRDAVAFESQRQVREWLADHDYLQGARPNENRGWDAEHGVTEFQRDKEAAHDYRYFPDPDLAPVEFAPQALERVRAQLPELPGQRRRRYVEQLRLDPHDADTILTDRATADLMEAAIAAGGPPELVTRQFVNLWLPLANERDTTVDRLGVEARRIGRLAELVKTGVINATAASSIAPAMITSAADPMELAERMGLLMVVDVSQLERWVEQAFEQNAQAVRDALGDARKAKAAAGFLRGQVMRVSGGRADPRQAGALIAQRLERLGGSS